MYFCKFCVSYTTTYYQSEYSFVYFHLLINIIVLIIVIVVIYFIRLIMKINKILNYKKDTICCNCHWVPPIIKHIEDRYSELQTKTTCWPRASRILLWVSKMLHTSRVFWWPKWAIKTFKLTLTEQGCVNSNIFWLETWFWNRVLWFTKSYITVVINLNNVLKHGFETHKMVRFKTVFLSVETRVWKIL